MLGRGLRKRGTATQHLVARRSTRMEPRPSPFVTVIEEEARIQARLVSSTASPPTYCRCGETDDVGSVQGVVIDGIDLDTDVDIAGTAVFVLIWPWKAEVSLSEIVIPLPWRRAGDRPLATPVRRRLTGRIESRVVGGHVLPTWEGPRDIAILATGLPSFLAGSKHSDLLHRLQSPE